MRPLMLCVLGSLLVVVGLSGIISQNAMLRGADLTAMLVGGLNQRCSSADCPSVNCFAAGTTQCSHWDDYWLSEEKSCITAEGWSCTLSDYQGCYDIVTCTKSAFACNASSNCPDKHTPCSTTTYKANDNCDETSP